MANASHVYVGSARMSGKVGGIFRRKVGDDRWEQLPKGLPEATNVQAITVHPTNHDVVYIGTNDGPYRTLDRGERWDRLDFPKNHEVWSIAFQANDPRIEAGSLVGQSDHGVSLSLYAKDPDGLEFEGFWTVPGGQPVRTRALDLDAELARRGMRA